MLVLLPLAAGALLAVLARHCRGPEGGDARDALLFGAAGAGGMAVFSAELVGALGLLRRGPVALAWAAVVLVALAIHLARKRAGVAPARSGTDADRQEKAPPVLLAGAMGLFALVLATAVFAPPNTWDALTYHLPRVAHWIQNGSLAPYPTAIRRQLDLPVFSELAVAHLAILFGSDRLSNLVACLALGGSALAASAVARELGASRRGETVAGIAALTAPMAILQASGTQTDLVLSLWLLVFALCALLARRAPRSLLVAVGAAASLGLAVATKPTGALFAAPFAVGLGVGWIRRIPGRAAAARILAVVLGALAVNAGHFARNLALFGSPVPQSYGAVNETFGPAALVSNASRDAAIQLASPSSAWNRAVESGTLALHRLIGMDASDPRTTWKGARFAVPPVPSGAGRPDADETLAALFHEDLAASPLLFLLVTAAALFAAGRVRKGAGAIPAGYTASLSVAFFLFVLILKWQPWHCRLELPLLLLGAPLVGAAFRGERVGTGLSGRRSDRAAEWLGLALLVLALPWAVGNASRPLLGPASVLKTPRFDQYFANRPDLLEPYRRAAAAARSAGCRDFGLRLSPDDGEYLLWVALGSGLPAAPRIEHVGVSNPTGSLAREARFASFRPCAIVDTVSPAHRSAGVLYSAQWPGGRISVEAVGGLPAGGGR